MMKIVLGIAPEDHAAPPTMAETMLRRLRFPDATVDMVDVIPEALESGLAAGVFGDLWSDLTARIRQEARQRLAAAAAALGDGYAATPVVLSGHPAETLLDHADAIRADLIAVNGSTGKPPLLGALIGSVARALAIGSQQSFLVARGAAVIGNSPVRAVLATDHSPYLEHCLKTLIAFAPRGIDALTVLTVIPENASRSETLRRCEMVVARLQQAPGFADAALRIRVAEGKASEVISAVMAESTADLLIVGAQGHGFLERLTLGSVSFEQAVRAHPWSVLVLRA